MLHWDDGNTFATGRSSYSDDDGRYPSATARIHINVEFEGVRVLALLDTGSSWSVVNADLATELGLFDREGESMTTSSRVGDYRGKLVRARTIILAEAGESIEIKSTVFVSHQWPRGDFIGYSGFLEKIRFAVDPGTNSFIFGTL